MVTRSRLVAGFMGLVLLCACPGQSAGQPVKGQPVTKAVLMQRKLQQAQKLLEGLALNDFAKIESSTDELLKIRADLAWMVLKTPRYEMLSDDFQKNLEGVKKGAKAKNIDGVALSYVEMTLSCVKCHQYLRDQGIGKLPIDRPRLAAE